jgi:hypothetical protein
MDAIAYHTSFIDILGMENIAFMSFLDLVQVLIDFGLVVLIAMVQIIIYPSFLYYKSDSLRLWHNIYTGKITLIVAPLMISQLGLATFLLIDKSTYSIVEVSALAIVAVNWLLTMFIFIPLHEQIDKTPENRNVQRRLVRFNGIRVVLFCLVFSLHFIAVLTQETSLIIIKSGPLTAIYLQLHTIPISIV